MTSKKKLTKKFILTADLHGKTQEDTLAKETDMVKAQIANPGLVAGLNPTALAVQAKIVAITDPNTGLIHQRAVAEALTKSLTLQINEGIADVKNIIVDDWMPQTQTALTATPALALTAASNAALLLFGVKGIAGGAAQTTSIASMSKNATSAPVIVKIDTDVAGEHILHIHNNITGKRGHPTDVAEVDVYAQNGGTQPVNLAALQAAGGQILGEAERGVYINFIPTTVAKNTQIFYIAVYKGKKTKKTVAQSVVASAAVK